MEWTVTTITNLCTEYCRKCGVEFKGEVVINGRLKKSLGRCIYTIDGNSVCTPIRIEIAAGLLKVATDESIMDVIGHECAHYVTAAITKEKHGHDAVFKFYCSKIGTKADKTTVAVDRIIPPEKSFKYTFYCKKCGKFLGGRHRMCKEVQNLDDYYSTCCNSDVTLQQNW